MHTFSVDPCKTVGPIDADMYNLHVHVQCMFVGSLYVHFLNNLWFVNLANWVTVVYMALSVHLFP